MPRSPSNRRRNKWQQPHRPLSSMNSVRRSITESDGTWIVQQIRSGTPGKVYICPGCNQDLPASTPHTVAWRSGDEFGWGTGVGERRHWHTSCFNARSRR
ncbi:hypothetical protein HMPREF3172_08125 [Brevibacterium sp. HMSC08F02]|uniref:ATP/GTP-binding protein n=2 Tax=Brevibacterium ravenspurgense TaxID=479117 RepID=A0A2I1IJB8_9MICO|nr:MULTISPECIES: hypothetical protein [Brevibacterium]OFT25180.1 hypothetical protein HMPREF3172_08125 [Brevibacterium sp. HMSC08F02]PKY71236.1 hypothetical protein CYJ40_00735 [Brevibacterium ravenspurgense]